MKSQSSRWGWAILLGFLFVCFPVCNYLSVDNYDSIDAFGINKFCLEKGNL